MNTNTVTSEILVLLGATGADFIILTMGAGVVLFVLFLWNMVRCLNKRYQILNSNHLVLWSIVDPDSIQWQHSGEYHIDIKARADIAAIRKKVSED